MAYLENFYLHRHKCPSSPVRMSKWLIWVIVACTDTNAHPVQSHVCVELPHMAHPHPRLPGVVRALLFVLPNPALAPFAHTCTIPFLAEDINHHITSWCTECYTPLMIGFN
jgi:hypothetical protein